MNRFSLLDIFLLPRGLFRRIGAARWSIIPAVLLVGFVDILAPLSDKLPVLADNFVGTVLFRGLIGIVLQIIIAGIIDVLFFTIPLFAALSYFKKDNEISRQADTFIKLVKIYALSHVIIIPVNELIYFYVSRLNPQNNGAIFALAAIYFYFIMRFWFTGVISRGINVLYRLEALYANLIFLLVFFWNILLGEALVFIIDRFLTHLTF